MPTPGIVAVPLPCTVRKIRCGAILIAALTSVAFSVMSSAAADGRFCVVPVRDVPKPFRATLTSFRIPGLPGPVVTGFGALDNTRMIDGARRLVPYDGLFPASPYDKGNWVREPWSGRLVATPHLGPLVVLRPGSDRFEQIAPRRTAYVDFSSGSAVLPRSRTTVVIENPARRAMRLDEDGLSPWLPAAELDQTGIRGIVSIHDSPYLGGVVLRDTRNVLFLRTDGGAWHLLRGVSDEAPGRLYDLPKYHAAVYLTVKSATIIRKTQTAGGVQYAASRLPVRSRTDREYVVSPLFGELLAFQTTGLFVPQSRWRRLTGRGFEDIAGGTQPPADARHLARNVRDLPHSRFALMTLGNGAYAYDGDAIAPIEVPDGHDPAPIGAPKSLPTLERDWIRTRTGLYELESGRRLVPVSLPDGIDTSGTLVDWPDAGVVLLGTADGIYAIDKTLKAERVESHLNVPLDLGVRRTVRHPVLGDMVILQSNGFYSILDTKRHGQALCKAAERRAARIETGNFCVRPVPSTSRQALDGNGIDRRAIIEAPGGAGILFDLDRRGLHVLTPDNQVERVQFHSHPNTRQLDYLPWLDQVLVFPQKGALVDRTLSATPIESLDTYRAHSYSGVFPSLRSLFFFQQDFRQTLLRLDPGRKPRLIPLAEKLDLRPQPDSIVDTPWFGGTLFITWDGLVRLEESGEHAPFRVDGFQYPRHGGLSITSISFTVPRLKSVYGFADGFGRITHDRKWQKITFPTQADFPTYGIRDHADPGQGRIGIAADTGVFALDEDGTARALANGPSQSVRSMTLAHRSDLVLAGGIDGLYRVDFQTLTAEQVENAGQSDIGAVEKIVPVPFAGFTIVKASRGVFAYTDDGLKRLPRDLTSLHPPLVFPQNKRVLATGSRHQGALLELLRTDDTGACSRPLTKASTR